MSTNSECQFVEVEPGRWYYVLERYNAPKNANDWREHADAYGPFGSEDAAEDHLRENHANPGGSSSRAYREGFKPDAVLAKLIENARSAKKRSSSMTFGRSKLGGFGRPW